MVEHILKGNTSVYINEIAHKMFTVCKSQVFSM